MAQEIEQSFGTPCFVYDLDRLEIAARQMLSFPHVFGLTVRYAMKAAPTAAIVKFFDRLGLFFDASSGFEVKRLLTLGIAPQKISLSTQELPDDFPDLMDMGVEIHASSLEQIRRIGCARPSSRIGLRFNPGLGSGSTNRTNVGGVASSFGIWHEKKDLVLELLRKFRLEVFRIHTHIGSGSDPEVWRRVALLSLQLVDEFPTVTHLNLGGGYKVARVSEEKATDLEQIGSPVSQEIQKFFERTGRKLHLEIEPGTFLVANAGAVLCRVQDIVDTGNNGFTFLKLNTGMTEILRPSLYGAQHPIFLLHPENRQAEMQNYVVVGHCCESGDILTPSPGEPEVISTRKFPRVEIGDFCFIGGAGAYCSGMATKNYNSFPEAAEILLDHSKRPHLIRKRQTLAQILQNEIVSEEFFLLKNNLIY
ncbi:MAG: diaminopimelate decarboxylase [Chthoniobacterales bacterium]|nr:diaminopimelate decarboxylase [Chthoniobacterales bacterium]